VDVHGVRAAHLAWTFGLNGINTDDSVITRFTFIRGSDGHFKATAAEAIRPASSTPTTAPSCWPPRPGTPRTSAWSRCWSGAARQARAL